MATTNINVKTDTETKKAAEFIFSELGLNMSSAINIFLRQTIRSNGIPFELKIDIPNKATAEAIEEGRRIAYDKDTKGYNSIDELRAALEV